MLNFHVEKHLAKRKYWHKNIFQSCFNTKRHLKMHNQKKLISRFIVYIVLHTVTFKPILNVYLFVLLWFIFRITRILRIYCFIYFLFIMRGATVNFMVWTFSTINNFHILSCVNHWSVLFESVIIYPVLMLHENRVFSDDSSRSGSLRSFN